MGAAGRSLPRLWCACKSPALGQDTNPTVATIGHAMGLLLSAPPQPQHYKGIRMNLEALKADLKRDEGLKLKPYTDTVGKLTIGYGRNLEMGITGHEAEVMLDTDIARCIVDLDLRIRWWRDLPEPAQRGLANLCFNIGLPRLLKFEKMLAALERGDMETAAREALDSKWARQVGDRAQRIATLFRSA